MLKLLAIELHTADLSSPIHREACQSILAHLYGQEIVDTGSGPIFSLQNHVVDPGIRTTSKSKVLYSKLTIYLLSTVSGYSFLSCLLFFSNYCHIGLYDYHIVDPQLALFSKNHGTRK